jgi:eukaryotic-like serine/threonine-protein kinase
VTLTAATGARNDAVLWARMPLLPLRLEDYDLKGPLGSGSMARVYEAVHKETGVPVAIKMLDVASRRSRERHERLAREAMLLTGVESPYVNRLIGFGWGGHLPFLVLERLEGETLADLLKREQRLDTPRLALWIEQLLEGTRDCHAANVIHRDLKPANIFLSRERGGISVRIIDFGVARLNEIVALGEGLTHTNHLLGSMGYMAPEQLASARTVGPPADLYAIGVVIYRCVSGRLPFALETIEAATRLKCEHSAPRLSSLPDLQVGPELDDFVACALETLSEDRFPSAGAMLDAWRRVVPTLPQGEEEIDVVFEEPAPEQDAKTLDSAQEAKTVDARVPHEELVRAEQELERLRRKAKSAP